MASRRFLYVFLMLGLLFVALLVPMTVGGTASEAQGLLSPAAAYVTIEPSTLTQTLVMGDQVTQTSALIITNTGDSTLNFELMEMQGGFMPAHVGLGESDGTYVRGSLPASTGRPPIDHRPQRSQGHTTASSGAISLAAGANRAVRTLAQILGTHAYATDAISDVHTQVDLGAPEILPILGTFDNGGNVPGAGEYVDGYVYVLDFADNLHKVGPATGFILSTTLVTAPPSGDYSGLALDPTTGVLYASSTDVGVSHLSTVDPDTGDVTLIGPITGMTATIAIAIDGTGQLYGYDIVGDNFWRINKFTGSATFIGNIGFDANFAQGMAWDPNTDQFYMSAFNNGTFQAELRVVDRDTGNTALVGALGETSPGGLRHLPWLGIPLVEGGVDIPWFDKTPVTGTLAPLAGQAIDIGWWANVPEVNQPGTYHARLKVNSNDPVNPDVILPITMTVLPQATMGKVTGRVTNACTDGPIEAAITILNGDPITQTMSAAATGAYTAWLYPGAYDLVFSATHFLPYTTSVTIVSGVTETLDVGLISQWACIATTPQALSYTLTFGEHFTQTPGLTINNTGDSALHFNTQEVEGGFVVAPQESPLNAAHFGSGAGLGDSLTALTQILGTSAYATEWISQMHTQVDLDMPGILPNLGDLDMIGDFPGAGEYVDGFVYVADNGNVLYQLDPLNASLIATRTLTPPPNSETYSGFALDPTTGVLYASSTNVGESSLFTVDVDTGNTTRIGPISGMMATIAIAIDGTGQLYGYDIVGDDFWAIDKTTGIGTRIGSIGFDANFGQGMAWDPNTDQLYLAAFNSGTFQAELRIADRATGNTTLVGVLGDTDPGGLRHLPWLGIPLQVGATDVPWITESPVVGTVAPYTSTDVDIGWWANVAEVSQPGIYYAGLKFSSNDPYHIGLTLPVTLNVLPGASMGNVTGRVMDTCTGEPVEAQLDIIDGNPITQTMSDAGTGTYIAWLEAGTYNVVFDAVDYQGYATQINITAGGSTTLDVDLVPDRACLDVAPNVAEVWVLSGTPVYTFAGGLHFTNHGNQTLNFEIVEMESDFVSTRQRQSLPPAGDFLRGDAPLSSGRVPAPDAPASARPSSVSVLMGMRAFGTETVSDFNTRFDLDVPDILPSLGPFDTGAFPGAGEYVNGYLYILDDDNILYKLDPADGRVIMTRAVAPPPAGTYTGLALDPTTGVVYVGSTSVGQSHLATLDVDTGTVITVGELISIPGSIALAIDGTGQLYSYDITTDDFWAIDKATADCTLIGSIGFDANFGQGMAWDPNTDQIYLGAFNSGTFQAELRIADRATGNTTLVGPLGETDPGGLVQLSWLGIPIPVSTLDVPWIWEDPTSGIVPFGAVNSRDVKLLFTALYTDATPMPLGTYSATLGIFSNDLVAGPQKVRAIMHIVDAYVAPTATFDAQASACMNTSVAFTNTSIAGVPRANFVWDFGDGMTSTLEHPVHTYTVDGTHTVTLEACNPAGCDVATSTVVIQPPPQANFNYSVSQLEVTFSNTSLAATHYTWNFGDGITSTLESPVHVYTSEGSYTVTLQTIGMCGLDTYSQAGIMVREGAFIYLPLVVRSYP